MPAQRQAWRADQSPESGSNMRALIAPTGSISGTIIGTLPMCDIPITGTEHGKSFIVLACARNIGADTDAKLGHSRHIRRTKEGYL